MLRVTIIFNSKIRFKKDAFKQTSPEKICMEMTWKFQAKNINDHLISILQQNHGCALTGNYFSWATTVRSSSQSRTLELPDRMRPLATLQQSSLITEGRPSWKKHSFMGIAILEGVCVFGGGGASNFSIIDIRNDIIFDQHRVGACRAGQRVGVNCVMPKRKEKSFFSWRSF